MEPLREFKEGNDETGFTYQLGFYSGNMANSFEDMKSS